MRELIEKKILSRPPWFEALGHLKPEQAIEYLKTISDSDLLHWFENMVKKSHYEPGESFYCDTDNVMS